MHVCFPRNCVKHFKTKVFRSIPYGCFCSRKHIYEQNCKTLQSSRNLVGQLSLTHKLQFYHATQIWYFHLNWKNLAHQISSIKIFLIKSTFGEFLFFHSNIDFNVPLNSFHEFYIIIFHSWKNTFDFLSLTINCLRSHFLWCDNDIRSNNKLFYLLDFLKENINFVQHLSKPSGAF